MSTLKVKTGASSRLLSVILVISMLICSLPLYINSVSYAEEYDLPWLWPVPGSYVITGLDYYYSGSAHGNGQAIDIGNNGYTGDTRLDVISATSGEVLYIQNSYNETTNRGSGWGNYVIVKSGNVCIIYGHLQSVTCKYGTIKAGDVIGKMGNTGNSTGVHLHLQAYPYDQSSSSTDIRVFDKYINNPLYVPHFRFRSGVITHSKLYGAHLGAYYTTLSGEDHVYSGGYFGDYRQAPLGAIVKSIRTKGARIYSQPLKSSSQTETVAFGQEITVYGYYTDAYGAVWYLISDSSYDKWIPASDVGFSEYTFGAKYEYEYPLSEKYGTFFDIYFDGTISVSNTIKTVKAVIRNDSGVVASYEADVNSNIFKINNTFSTGFGINGLADGEYTYEIIITEKAYYPGADELNKTYTVFSSNFVIDKAASDEIPPLVEEIKVVSMTQTNIRVTVNATDNKKVQNLYFVVTNGSGFELKLEPSCNGSVYTVDIPVSSLNGSGNYTITAKALDPYMNSDESSISITLPSGDGSETWKVQVSSHLNLRKGPGTNYGIASKLNNNDLITFSEYVYNTSDGRYWANVGGGWAALSYAVYQSGSLYNITFNLLGGSADYSVMNKPLNQNVTIPVAKPTRAGYTFVGWASSPTATSAEYLAGSVYSKNESAVLFAVWQDATAPVINGVTVSPDGYVNDKVTLTVSASDNGGAIYYSFDGGVSYRRSNSIDIFENQTISANTIIVKDPSGNRTAYNVNTVISNIDTMPPTIDDTTLGVSVSGQNATFTFGQARDDVSGIDKYTLVYSKNSDFSDPVSQTVTSGHTVTLDSGVYYAKLIITDKVGNKTEEEFNRFVVGDQLVLSTPENFVLQSASPEMVVLAWKTVNNADYYVVTVSESPDFSNSFERETTNNTITLDTLERGKTYYAKLVAVSYDGVYASSDPTATVIFEMVSSDNTLYSFKAFNAQIDGQNASATLPYATAAVDLSCTVHEKATVKYYSDAALNSEIVDYTSYPFAADNATVYIVVIAENESKATYTLTLSRASRDAEVPNVVFEASGESIYVGESCKEIQLTASVADGGTLTVVWYSSFNGQEHLAFANGLTCTPNFKKAGSYKVYAVVTNTNSMCQNSVATFKTAEIEYTVMRNGTQIVAVISDFVYNGSPASAAYSLYNGDGEVTYKFFSDDGCVNEIAPPVDAGEYWVKAYAAETDLYEAAESLSVKFSIVRANNTNTPSYTIVQPTLRERFGKLTVTSSGVELSINGGDYTPMESGREYTVDEGAVVSIRYAETANANASVPVEISVIPFSGTDGFYPSSGLDAKADGDYLIVNTDDLIADALISLLTKKDNIELSDTNGTLMNGTNTLLYSGCKISIVDAVGVYSSLTVIILGDADRNGSVTYDDVVKIMKLSNGMSSSSDALDILICDLDGDGAITSLDAAKAYKKI